MGHLIGGSLVAVPGRGVGRANGRMRLILILPSGCRRNKSVSLNINEVPGARRAAGTSLHCCPLGHGAQLVTWAAAGKTENNNAINDKFQTIGASS